MPNPSLYRQILGDAFERLPESLREFHDSAGGGRAVGRMNIGGSRGSLARLVRLMLRLPRPGIDVPVNLRVNVQDAREMWSRDFGDRRFVTVQWCRNGMLMEQLGPLRMAFHLSGDGQGIHFALRRAWFFAIPLMKFLAPSVHASETAEVNGWRVSVRVCLPGGLALLHYDGLLRLETLAR